MVTTNKSNAYPYSSSHVFRADLCEISSHYAVAEAIEQRHMPKSMESLALTLLGTTGQGDKNVAFGGQGRVAARRIFLATISNGNLKVFCH